MGRIKKGTTGYTREGSSPVSILFLSAIIFLIDGVVKRQLETHMTLSQSIPLIPNILHITLVHNTGSAMGLWQGKNAVFAVISAFATIAFIAFFWQYSKSSRLLRICSGLILGGAFSNLFDRLYYKYIVDYIDIRIWPVFNLSDSCITVGFALIVWYTFMKNKRAS